MDNPGFSVSSYKRNFNRRMKGHDYRLPGLYHITILKNPVIPNFSTLVNSTAGDCIVETTALGEIIERNLLAVGGISENLKIWYAVVMPDHIHILLQVKDILELPLGRYIAKLKGRISRGYWDSLGIQKGDPVFDAGFNDRLIKDGRQRERVKTYIADNPRRLWVKRQFPEFYRMRYEIEVEGQVFQTLGNRFLLDDYDIEPVRVSRSFSERELTERKRGWWFNIRNGGVLVSPFIHQDERRVRDVAVEYEGRLILLIVHRFGPRYKPPGELFDLCREGRLLILAPKEGKEKDEVTREEALWLNGIAEKIAGGDFRKLF